ncbi:hypothetical protein [Nisaea sp.]|uniref:hypothetical protein n=1 Tax=Nisaea sp. TaxID=2024842 RepID=UPI0032649B3C
MSKRPKYKTHIDYDRMLSDLHHARDELTEDGHSRGANAMRRAIKQTNGARRDYLKRSSDHAV